MSYELFQEKIVNVLKAANVPLTWTEVRTEAELPQLFPNNQWVRRMEKDVDLHREKDQHGVMHWSLQIYLSDTNPNAKTAKTTEKDGNRSSGKPRPLE